MFSTVSSRFKTYAGKLGIIVGAIALMIFAWANLFFQVNTTNAHAATINGVSNQVEGKVEEGLGSARRATGDLTDNYKQEAKGAAQQLKGKSKQGLGSAENKLDDTKDTLEDKSESLIDSVKDFFD